MTSKGKPEQIYVWRPDDLTGIELRRGVAVREPYPRHWHEEYQFCFIQSGGGELFYRGTHHNTPQQSMFVVHPGEVHSNHTEIGCTFRSIYVDTALVSRMALGITGDTQAQPFFPDAMVFDDDILSNYRLLCHSFEESATTLERESLLLEILILLVDRHAEERVRVRPPQKERKAVEKVREFIVEFHAQNISLQELSSLVALSPFHLTRVFTREIGMPPHAFQNQVRVVNAKRLIRNGLPLSDVAALIGFADQSHFIRHFKRLMKITPGEYMKTARTFYTAFSHSV